MYNRYLVEVYLRNLFNEVYLVNKQKLRSVLISTSVAGKEPP